MYMVYIKVHMNSLKHNFLEYFIILSLSFINVFNFLFGFDFVAIVIYHFGISLFSLKNFEQFVNLTIHSFWPKS